MAAPANRLQTMMATARLLPPNHPAKSRIGGNAKLSLMPKSFSKRIALTAAFTAALVGCDQQTAPARQPTAEAPASIAPPVAAPASPHWSDDSRFAEVVMDAQSGAIIYGQNETAPRHIASLTKIMTAYMVFQALEDGRLSRDTQLMVSRHAAGQGGTGLDIEPGDILTVDDALHALVTLSANDAAVVLAEALAGSEIVFAESMTAAAARLGTLSTTFRTASGLTQPGQISSARDIAIIFARLQQDHPRHFARYFSAPVVYINGQPQENCALCHQDDTHIVGQKGGFTNAAGRSLAVVTQDRGHRQVIVTLGAPTQDDRASRIVYLARHYAAPAA